jgi:hypothetical protein
MAWPINRPLDWIIRALNLRAGDSPRELEDGPVNTTFELAQGGHALASWETVSPAALTMTGAVQLVLLLSRDENVSRLVRMHLARSGAGGAMAVRVGTSIDNASSNLTRLYEDYAWAAGTDSKAWAELGEGQQWWYIPPGFSLVVRVQGVAGDALESRAQVGTFPKGVKPF